MLSFQHFIYKEIRPNSSTVNWKKKISKLFGEKKKKRGKKLPAFLHCWNLCSQFWEGKKIPNSWATKLKQWGERKALWYLCFPALKNLHRHPQAACYMHRWMAAWPNSKVLCKAKTLPTPGPKIPHKVPNEANFQWQAIRTQATKALAGLSTGCSSWLFQGCSGCQHSASRGNWCHPDLCWQTPKAHPRCPDSSLPPGHEWCWIQ